MINKDYKHDKLTTPYQVGSRTDLLNELEVKIEHYRQHKLPLYIFLIKLENFTKISKNRGDLGTGCVIHTLVERLISFVNEQGVTFQFNADQIVLICSGTQYDFNPQVLDEMINQLRNPVSFCYDIITVELVMGFVEMQPEMVANADELIKRAETALLLAKAEQSCWRHCTCLQCQPSRTSDQALFKELKLGLTKVDLHLAGQPIYDFNSGKLSIVEVLLRWQHAVQGAINPLKIIELASKNGYLYHVAIYVSQRLADFLVEQKTRYQEVSFAINFNMPQIINKKLIENIFEIFDQQGIDRSKLIFESTETDAMPVSFEDAAGHFHWIRQQGVQVAMDDFGSGYSTLALLTSIEVDLVKMDRSLVTDIEHNSRRFETLLAILQLCVKLELTVVVEGVENEQQHQLLLDCQIPNLLVQGFYYGKPCTLHTQVTFKENIFIQTELQSFQPALQGI